MTRTRDPILDLLAPLRRYAFALTRDRAEADDLVQDALLRGHEQRRQLAPGKAPGPWLRAILRNRFLDRRRHDQAQSRREAQFAQLTESFAMTPPASVSGLYCGHAESHYFGVGKIDPDQVADYARRKGWDIATAERWLSPILNYDPEPTPPVA